MFHFCSFFFQLPTSERPKHHILFSVPTGTPKFREPIDHFLMSYLVPLLAAEDPTSVHPSWNLDIPPEKRCPFTYSEILGDLHPSPSAAAAVNAAVGSAWQGMMTGSFSSTCMCYKKLYYTQHS